MHKEDKDKIKLTIKEILFYLVDSCVLIEEIFNPKSRYNFSKSFNEYWQKRNVDKSNFCRQIYRLNRQKYTKTYFKGKNKYIKLTKKGKRKIKNYLINDIKIKKSKKWDRKWRMVIFDIPEDKKLIRNLLSRTLTKLGFINLQKSVYVYPFACYEEINQIRSIFNCRKYIQYIIADKIETEVDLIKKFYNKEILNEKLNSK